jgi:O-antigen/teichoic acid export membrane protein
MSQILPVVMLPIFAKFYTPDEFGHFAIFMSICAILSVFSTGRYEFAILKPKEDAEAFLIFQLSSILVFITSALVFLLIIAFYYLFSQNDFIQSLNKLELFLIPLGIFNLGIFQTYSYWLTRKEKFKFLSILKLLQSVFIIAATILIATLGFSNTGLVSGFILGGSFITLFIIFQVFNGAISLNWKYLYGISKNFSEYPKYLMPTALLDSAAIQAPIFFITSFFGSVNVGAFSVANRIVAAPITLVSASVGQFYFQNISSALNKQIEIKKVFNRTLLFLVIASIFVFISIYFLSPIIFPILFDKVWIKSVDVIQILCFGLFVRFIVSPLSTTLVSLGAMKSISLWQFSYLLSTVIFFTIFKSFEFLNLLWSYTIHETIHYIVYFLIIKYHVSKN